MPVQPVYVIIDTSTSMRDDKKISAVNEGLRIMVESLRNNPIAFELVSLSFICFSDEAEQVLPLTPLYQIKPSQIPELKAKGWTNIESSLRLLKKCIDKEVVKTDIIKEIKGDKKPLVFFLSDGGESRGKWKNFYSEWEKLHKQLSGFYVLAAFGGQYKTHFKELGKMAFGDKYVMKIDQVTSENIINWFVWVSQSIPT